MRGSLVALIGLLASGALGHPANVASAKAKVGLDRVVEVRVRFDLLAFLLDERPSDVDHAEMLGLLSAPLPLLESRLQDAASRFREGLHLLGDGGMGAINSVTFPAASEIQEWRERHEPSQLPILSAAVAKGRLPEGAGAVSVRFPDVLGTVVLTTEMPYQEPVSEPVEAGRASRPLSLPTAQQVAEAKAAALRRLSLDKSGSERVSVKAKKPATNPPIASSSVAPGPRKESIRAQVEPPRAEKKVIIEPRPVGRFESFPGFLRMGFHHILPEGLDHILFVLGLFLLSSRMRDLVKQITAFTVAHSLTLALSLYGVVRLPSTVVEPIIALSIAFVAIENLFSSQMRAWRPIVVFAFGLVHGLGFAGALQDMGLARGDFLTALLGFNIGVEAGQLTVILIALALVGWFRNSARFRPLVAMPASVAIAAVALVWTFQRLA
jgi:hypothetical protein